MAGCMAPSVTLPSPLRPPPGFVAPEPVPGLAALPQQSGRFAGLEFRRNRRDIQRRACANGRRYDKQLPVPPANLNLPLASRLLQQGRKALARFGVGVNPHGVASHTFSPKLDRCGLKAFVGRQQRSAACADRFEDIGVVRVESQLPCQNCDASTMLYRGPARSRRTRSLMNGEKCPP